MATNKYGDTILSDGRIYIVKPSGTLDQLVEKVKQKRPLTRTEYTWVYWFLANVKWDWLGAITTGSIIKPAYISKMHRPSFEERTSAKAIAKRAKRRARAIAKETVIRKKAREEEYRVKIVSFANLKSPVRIPNNISLADLKSKLKFIKSLAYQDLYTIEKLIKAKKKRAKTRKIVKIGLGVIAAAAGGSVLLAKTAPMTASTASLLPAGTGVVGPATLTSSGSIVFGTGTGLVGTSLPGTFGAGSLFTSGAAVTVKTGILSSISGAAKSVATKLIPKAVTKTVLKSAAVKATEFRVKEIAQKKIAKKMEKVRVKEQAEIARIEKEFFGVQDNSKLVGEHAIHAPKYTNLPTILSAIAVIGVAAYVIAQPKG